MSRSIQTFDSRFREYVNNSQEYIDYLRTEAEKSRHSAAADDAKADLLEAELEALNQNYVIFKGAGADTSVTQTQ